MTELWYDLPPGLRETLFVTLQIGGVMLGVILTVAYLTLAATIALYAVFLASIMPRQAADSSAYTDAWGAPDRHD